MNHKIALNMICYNETDDLDRCLSSIVPYVDKAFVTITSDNKATEEICKKHGVDYDIKLDLKERVTKQDVKWLAEFFGWTPEMKEKDELFYFDKARNHVLQRTPKEYKYVLWLDADDMFRGGDKLKQLVDEMDKDGYTSMFMNYLYDVELDKQGKIRNILIQHLRERLVINDGRYKWVAPIHETLIAQTGEVKQKETSLCDVVHFAQMDKKLGSIQRNIKVLEKEICNNKGTDPRPLYYLAKAFYDHHTPEHYLRAEKLIYRYLKMSGWAEERCQAYEYLAEMFRAQKEYNRAVKAGHNALIETAKFPTTYLSLALTNLCQGRYDEAMHWVQLAGKVPMPQTTLVINPRDMVARTLEVIFNVGLQTSQLDQAWAAVMELHKIFPQDETILNHYKNLTVMRDQRDTTKKFVEIARHLMNIGDTEKLKLLALAAPSDIQDNPIIAEFIKQYRPAKKWSDKSIVIYCGPGFTTWNPDNLKNKGNTFIGGSEEAVILQAHELTKLGYEVTVYGDPGQEGIYNGVTYLNYFQFNSRDNFNILMGWRNILFFEESYKAKKTYLWLHDVPDAMMFTKKRLDNVHKIMCLSQAHRNLLPNIPDEKFFITSNGYIEVHKDIQSDNKPHRLIWTSSYDRGLNHLLGIWPEVKKEVPDAELRIFYGWQLFDMAFHNNPERMAWKKKIEEQMTYDGVYHGGRLLQDELEKEIKQAGIWAYPTDFFEINCISALKAQAFGAKPVVVNYGALKETVKFGDKVEGDIWDQETKDVYKRTLIEALKNPQSMADKKQMMEKIKETYTWDAIAKDWDAEFKHQELEEAMATVLQNDKSLKEFMPV